MWWKTLNVTVRRLIGRSQPDSMGQTQAWVCWTLKARSSKSEKFPALTRGILSASYWNRNQFQDVGSPRTAGWGGHWYSWLRRPGTRKQEFSSFPSHPKQCWSSSKCLSSSPWMQDRRSVCSRSNPHIWDPGSSPSSAINFLHAFGVNCFSFLGQIFPIVKVSFENFDYDFLSLCPVTLTCSLILGKTFPLSRPRFPHL